MISASVGVIGGNCSAGALQTCAWGNYDVHLVEQCAADTPVAVAAAFGFPLRDLHCDGVSASREVAERNVIRVGYSARAPVRTAHIR